MAIVLLVIVLVVCFSSAPSCTYTRTFGNGLAGLAGLLVLVAVVVVALGLTPGVLELHPFQSSAIAAR